MWRRTSSAIPARRRAPRCRSPGRRPPGRVRRHERELGGAALDVRVGLLVRRRRLAGSRVPSATSPRPAPSRSIWTLAPWRSMPASPSVHGNIRTPMSIVRKTGQCWICGPSPFVARMSSPCTHHSTIRDCTRYRAAMEPRSHGKRCRATRRPRAGRRRPGSLGGQAPRREDLPVVEPAAVVHGPRVEAVHGERIVRRERGSVRVELLGGVAAEELCGGRVRPAMCATTSRFHQPAAALGFSQLSGGAYWIIRPSRCRSAWATPISSSRSRPTSAAVPSSRARTSGRSGPARNRTFGGMRVLVAPDKFRGTLTARQAAEAVETGWRRTRPERRVGPGPDGGRRRGDAWPPSWMRCTARSCASWSPGPRDDPVEAAFGIVETADGTRRDRGDGVRVGPRAPLGVPARPATDDDARHRRADRRGARSRAASG